MGDLRELGKVRKVFIGRESHMIMTVSVDIDFGSSGQSFGGISLDKYDREKKRRVGTAAGLDLLLKLLDLFGVDSLDKAIGRPVYALRDREGLAGLIIGLETPAFDGGRKLLLDDWRNEWNL